MNTGNAITVIYASLVLFFASCGAPPYFEENVKMEYGAWNYNNPVVLEVNVDDTVSAFDFFLNLRITKSYEFSNIYVFFTTDLPDGHQTRDTIEAPLAEADGTWLGKVSGGLVENKILFKRNKRFPLTGKYKFTIEQAMRQDELTEVEEAGLRIEKAKR